MSEVGAEIIKTEETKESGVKYLNINVSNREVERDPDIVRLCSDVGILEYAKPKTGHWIEHEIEDMLRWLECSVCHCETYNVKHKYCMNCGAKMIEP